MPTSRDLFLVFGRSLPVPPWFDVACITSTKHNSLLTTVFDVVVCLFLYRKLTEIVIKHSNGRNVPRVFWWNSCVSWRIDHVALTERKTWKNNFSVQWKAIDVAINISLLLSNEMFTAMSFYFCISVLISVQEKTFSQTNHQSPFDYRSI